MKADYSVTVNQIMEECNAAMNHIRMDEVDVLINAINSAEKVFFIGVGRVMLSLKCFAKRLSHLGVSTVCVGDINEPAISNKDLLIVGSGSGESLIPVSIAEKAKSLGAKVAHIGTNSDSTIGRMADIFIKIPVGSKIQNENGVTSCQPMTSLFEQSVLLLGDTIAKMLIERNGLDMDSLWEFHANLE